MAKGGEERGELTLVVSHKYADDYADDYVDDYPDDYADDYAYDTNEWQSLTCQQSQNAKHATLYVSPAASTLGLRC